MTRAFKTAAVMTMVAALTAGTISAQSNGTDNPARPEFMNQQGRMNRKAGGFAKCFKINQKNEKPVIMGQIKSIDAKASIVKITNADGKDVDIHVSPFAKIMIFDPDFKPEPKKDTGDKKAEKKAPRAPATKFTISDLQKGSFVKIRTFDTTTKTPEAASICAQQKMPKQSALIDAK